MREHILRPLLLGGALLLTASACVHQAQMQHPENAKTEATKTVKPQSAPNADQGDHDMMVLVGGTVFSDNCARCHNPGSRAPNLMRQMIEASEIKQMVRQGSPPMPAFDSTRISDEKLDALVAYLQDAERNPPPPRRN